MSPINDELRALFSHRAAAVSPAPDPLGGIERRAKRMRRNRVAASVAGSALAVAAVAIAVPALRPDNGGGTTQFATSPSPLVSSTPSTTALPGSSLDPQHPWAYRGDPAVIAGNELVTLRAEWTTEHPGATLTPLFGQVYEPSAKPEVVFVSTAPGSDRWGIATSGESGWDFLYDEAIPFATKVLMAALPGDEVPRLLVVTLPSIGDISYAADGKAFSTMQMPYPGVAVHALEGDTSKDVVRILDGDGDIDNPVFQGPAPDYATASDGGAPAPTTPDNLLNWPARGETPSPTTVDAAAQEFARRSGVRADRVSTRLLFAGTNSARHRVVVLEAWQWGHDAQTFAYEEGGFDGGGAPGEVTLKGPAVVVLDLLSDSGPSTLVVIGEPAAARVQYAGSATAPFSSIEGGGAVLIARGRTPDDRIRLLDANGTMIFRGDVGTLLCGQNNCD